MSSESPEKIKEEGCISLEAMEHRALGERIINVMNTTFERLQIAIAIPCLLLEQGPMKKCIPDEMMETIRKSCSKYIQPLNYINDYSSETQVLIDHEIINAIDVVYNDERVRGLISKYVQFLPDTSKHFLELVNNLKQLVTIRITTSVQSEMEREKILHQLCHENAQIEQQIKKLKSKIRHKETIIKWKIAERQSLILKYRKDLAGKKWMTGMQIQREVATANDRMNNLRNDSEEYQQSLREQAEKAKRDYDKVLMDNIRADKKLREKKARTITQLKGWIKKYDNDVGERTEEVERLDAEMAEAQNELDAFMEKYNKQEEEYNAIVTMREAEEKKILEEKMLLFMMNRAARIIQRRWRQYYQKKKKKTKGKGKKGKK